MRRKAFLILLVLLIASAALALKRDNKVIRLTLDSSIAKSEARECGKCHTTEFTLWVSHSHSRALLHPEHDEEYIEAKFSARAKGFDKYVKGKFAEEDVKMAFGVSRTQVFWTKGEKGHELLPALWDMRAKQWSPLPRFLAEAREGGVIWEHSCAGCHASGFDPADDTYAAPAVSCRACHGDGDNHVEAEGKGEIIRPSVMANELRTELCGSCHARGKSVKGQYPYPVGFEPGMELADNYTVSTPVPGETTAEFWPDGTERQLNMEYQGYIQSKHYREGVTCTACHLPHGSPNKVGLRSVSVEICSNCHEGSPESKIHQTHPDNKAECIDCHMSMVNPGMNPFEVRTHTFKVLEPANALKWKMPDSCTTKCHEGKDAKWAAKALETLRKQ